MQRLAHTCLLAAFMLLLWSGAALAHCELPCGIYDDDARTAEIAEHITTIEKAMNTIGHLAGQKDLNHNQMVRWVVNKDHHAQELQDIVSQYFMTQRLKTDAKNYQPMLETLHRMLLSAMRCKQTTDLQHVRDLRNQLEKFKGLYFKEQ